MTPLKFRVKKQSTNTTMHHFTGPTYTYTYTIHHRGKKQEGALPFLYTLVSPGPHNTLVTTVYRKPTHTDQYLHWNSNHFITTKNSAYNTLVSRLK